MKKLVSMMLGVVGLLMLCGCAVGWNPICIIIPCHRVIGVDGSLAGYGGGLGNKVSLLAHEGADVVGGLCVAGVGRF